MLKKDTVRLLVFFKDFDGKVITPTDVKLTIYNTDETILEEITDGIIDNAQGNFHYDFVAPEHNFIFEYSGVYHSKPVLARQKITVNFTN